MLHEQWPDLLLEERRPFGIAIRLRTSRLAAEYLQAQHQRSND
jgi:hypothetical protein